MSHLYVTYVGRHHFGFVHPFILLLSGKMMFFEEFYYSQKQVLRLCYCLFKKYLRTADKPVAFLTESLLWTTCLVSHPIKETLAQF